MSTQVQGELYFARSLSTKELKFIKKYQSIIDEALTEYPKKNFTIFSEINSLNQQYIEYFQNKLKKINIYLDLWQSHYILSSSYPELKFYKNKITINTSQEKNDIITPLHMLNFLFFEQNFLFENIQEKNELFFNDNYFHGHLDVSYITSKGYQAKKKYLLNKNEMIDETLNEIIPFLIRDEVLLKFQPLIDFQTIKKNIGMDSMNLLNNIKIKKI